jgi:hypothetical protein
VSAITSRSLYVRQCEKGKAAADPFQQPQTWRLLMIDNSKVAKDDANGFGPAASRILARQLARPLTTDEIEHVAGGAISRGAIGGVAVARRADTCTGTGCPENDSDA